MNDTYHLDGDGLFKRIMIGLIIGTVIFVLFGL